MTNPRVLRIITLFTTILTTINITKAQGWWWRTIDIICLAVLCWCFESAWWKPPKHEADRQ